MFLSTTCTLPWTCPLSYPVPAQHICPEAKFPPMPTLTAKGSCKSSDGSWLSGSSTWSSGIGQAIVHSLPGVRQPTGTGLLAVWVSTSQTVSAPTLSQEYSYNHMKSQPIGEGSLPVPMEAMSFRVPPTQPYNLYSSLPQMSTGSTQEVAPSGIPISRPIHLTMLAPALHSQDKGSTPAPIFQQCGQTHEGSSSL